MRISDIHCDFSIAMTEVFGNCREGAENGEVFAIAKVKLQAVKFVLRTSEVKFALHFAFRRNFTIEDNFTYVVNFTCPQGQT